MRISAVHIKEIKAGDTVRHNDVLRTVCQSDISWSRFMGHALFGDSYRLGTKLVERVSLTEEVHP